MRQLTVVLAVATLGSGTAHAQQFTGAYVFGDSSVDSGWWAGAFAGQCDGAPSPCIPAIPPPNTQKNRKISNAIDAGSDGSPVGSGELMNSELLAGYFGLTAAPANQPGGTNYAISGSTNSDATGGQGNVNQNPLLPSTVEQIANYLDANGGVANPSGLYLISSGGNDISYIQDLTPSGIQRRAFMDAQADALIEGITALHDAGARTFIVNSNHGPGGPGSLGEFYTRELWTGLAAAGINFVPADISAMVRTVRADPTRFGFTAATVMPGVVDGGTSTGSACIIHSGAAGPQAGWGQWCVNTTTPSEDYAYLASADAQQTYFYSDDQHFSAAGQKIEADYVYSLVVAPSQISMLSESAIQTRTGIVNGIQRQIDASQLNPGASGVNAWVTCDVADLQTDNHPGFPEASGTPLTLSGGISYHLAPGVLVGAAASTGRNSPDWDGDRGGFEQTEHTASLYAAFKGPALWATVVGTYGALDYDVDRIVPLGIARFANHGETDGTNWSFAGQAGYDFHIDGVTTGPVAGVLWQRAEIDGFTETGGGVTSLGFSGQDRDSLVTTLGWRAMVDLGAWQPFAEVAWNHEHASTDRTVTAFLTSASYAPGYSMPGAPVAEDWATVTLGTTVDMGGGLLVLGSVRGDFDENGAQAFGGQLGLNIRF
jgi:outer membrane lipase/esterase